MMGASSRRSSAPTTRTCAALTATPLHHAPRRPPHYPKHQPPHQSASHSRAKPPQSLQDLRELPYYPDEELETSAERLAQAFRLASDRMRVPNMIEPLALASGQVHPRVGVAAALEPTLNVLLGAAAAPLARAQHSVGRAWRSRLAHTQLSNAQARRERCVRI